MAGVQVRLATPITSDDYVAGQRWRDATLSGCPWHPNGGCGFSRHGTYPRVRPPGTLIARWYCPLERRTVSALPDCLASHYSGTLVDLEAIVLAVEQAPFWRRPLRTCALTSSCPVHCAICAVCVRPSIRPWALCVACCRPALRRCL